MSQKVEVTNPLKNKKTSEEVGYEGEFEEMTQKVLKNPSVISSFPSENLDPPTPKATQKKRGSIFSRKRSKDDSKDEQQFFEGVKNEKKVVLLKNYTVEATKDPERREDYFILFSFICLFGGNTTIFDEIKHKSRYLSKLPNSNELYKELLQDKNYVSQVLISAANQHEDNVIKEIIKNDTLGYIVNIPVLLAFIKADMHGLLKSLLKVVDPNSKNNLKVIRGLIPQNLMESVDSPTQPLRLQKTLRNIGSSFEEKSPPQKLQFNSSVISENEALIKDGARPDAPRPDAPRLDIPAKAPQKDFMNRDPPPKSAYGNVIIEARFENMLPYLVQFDKLDIVDTLVDAFGERHINHMNLFITHGQEKVALKYYKKAAWDLTEAQILMLLNKRMWTFLCNIDDDFEKNFLFSDNVFSNIKDMLSDGKILTEVVLLFMTLPVNGWKQNQAVALIELTSGLLKEDPESSRLVYASNPILTCAQLAFILNNLSSRFRFLQNDLVNLSQRLEQLALNLQNEYRENNLYALYLKTLPTGLTMLDYILQMDMKILVETKFTKGLVQEFWDNETLITGSRTQISSLINSVHTTKRFQWTQDFKPKITTEYFSFQFGNVVNSAKYLLFYDLFFLACLYGILDDYTYNKINFFRAVDDDPTFLDSLNPYTLDVTYSQYPARTAVRWFIIFNFWFFFLFRTIHIFRQGLKNTIYMFGYLASFIFMTLTLLTLPIFPDYQSQIDNQLFIKLVLVFTRTAVAYVIGTSLLGNRQSGETITVVATVTASLIMILTMLIVYIIAAAEIMENFFRTVILFNTVQESFFSLVEILFGSITFIDVQNVSSESIYLATNSWMLIFAFSSTILATFLLIAYLSSIYEAVRQNASYQNTCTQYYYVQIYSGETFKGFYTFPPIVSGLVFPFVLLYRIPSVSKTIDMFLLKVRFFSTWVIYQVVKYLGVSLFYYLPVLYVKNIYLIFVGKVNTRGPRLFHLVAWFFAGIFVIFYIIFKDLQTLVKVMCSDWTVISPRQKLLQRVTDDDVIYISRYESLKEGLNNIKKENPEIQSILYMELLNYLMHGWKISAQDAPRSVLLKKEATSSKDRLVALIRKHAKSVYGSKWLRSIYDAKKKFYRELLDGFLTFKTRSMKEEYATIDPEIVLDMIKDVNEENIVYLRARQIFAIQKALLSMQSKEQISTMNKIEELAKKIESLCDLYREQYGEHKDVKWSRVIEGVKEIRPIQPRQDRGNNNERKAAILGTAVT